MAQQIEAVARELDRLVDRRVRLPRRVHGERRPGRGEPLRADACPVARSRAVSSATSVAVEAVSWMTPTNPSGRPDHLAQPVHHHLLQLGRRRRGGPRHALRADGGGEHLAQYRRRAVVAGEVGEPAGVVPVRHPRHDHPAEVVEQRVERLAVDAAAPPGSWRRMSPGATAGVIGQVADVAQVVGHPVHQRVRVAAKLVGLHPPKRTRPRALVKPGCWSCGARMRTAERRPRSAYRCRSACSSISSSVSRQVLSYPTTPALSDISYESGECRLN